jgi:hypothetical protein
MKEQLIDALIIAKTGNALLFDSFLSEIETLKGKIKHAFPPKVLIASVPSENIEKLRKCDFVGYLTTDIIDELPAPYAADEFPDIKAIWNKQIRISREPEAGVPADEDLSWDAPGHLPPDPPPHIRKMMDKWEKDSEKSGGSL